VTNTLQHNSLSLCRFWQVLRFSPELVSHPVRHGAGNSCHLLEFLIKLLNSFNQPFFIASTHSE